MTRAMRQFKYYQAYYYSFFSRELYQDVFRNWSGIGFSYIFILVLWLSIIGNLFLIPTVMLYIDDFKQVLHQTQQIEITNGHAQISQAMPYAVYDPNNPQRLIAIIDSTGKTNPEQAAQGHYFVNGQEILIFPEQQNIQSVQTDPQSVPITLSVLSDQVLTENNFMSGLGFFVLFIIILFYIIGLVLVYLFRIFQVLIYSVLGYLLFKRKKYHPNLEYSQVLRLTAMAITPPIFIGFLESVVNRFLNMPVGIMLMLNILNFIMAMSYLYFGFRVNRTEPPIEQSQTPTASVPTDR